MATLKIKKGDMVRVIAGRDKDKEGKVLAVDAKKNTVIVEGAHMISKHEKPSARNQNGGIVNKEAPIHLSNVMLLHKGKPTRVGFRIEGEGDKKVKVRIAKATGEKIE